MWGVTAYRPRLASWATCLWSLVVSPKSCVTSGKLSPCDSVFSSVKREWTQPPILQGYGGTPPVNRDAWYRRAQCALAATTKWVTQYIRGVLKFKLCYKATRKFWKTTVYKSPNFRNHTICSCVRMVCHCFLWDAMLVMGQSLVSWGLLLSLCLSHFSLWHLIYLCQILETADAVIPFLQGHGMGDEH